MKLIIRDIVKKKGEELLLSGAGYTFHQGRVYGINGPDQAKAALLDCISFEGGYDAGYMELDCGGKNCLAPAMVGQFLEEPVFPEFLTVREFVKYYIDINRKNISEIKSVDEYLALGQIKDTPADRTIRDFGTEEKMRLQFLCFLIVTPPVIIINGIGNISNVDFLKDIKVYIDRLKENSIVLFCADDHAVSVFLCDEQLSIENGYIQGGV